MKRKSLVLSALLALCAFAAPAMAHFQMVYTPESALEKAAELPLKLVFTHPFEAGHTMDMGAPQKFVVLHKGETTDLTASLKPITWKSLTNTGKAYESSYTPRGMGDWVFALTPAPYFEASEESYIQQIAKLVINTAGSPTDWDAELGLPAEIVPLDKPYGLWAGNVFRGIVKGNGQPVPFAEIEVEFLNHEPDMKANAFAQKAQVEAPQDSFVTQTIKADANGMFVYAIPKAGWWGFCALGVGPEKTFKDKDLSQDAVIWVQAKPMP
jgi:cobalt/nickel transport protein